MTGTPTPRQRERRVFKARTMWATAMKDDSSVCLWGSREDAERGCEPDEYVIRVRVTRAIRARAKE